MGQRYSIDAKIYTGAAGSTPAVELTGIRNETVNLDKEEVDISSRSSAWTLIGAPYINCSIDFEILDDDANTGIDGLWTAFTARTARAFKVVDKASGKGVDADWEITKMSPKKDLKGAIVYDITIKPTYVTRYPAAV